MMLFGFFSPFYFIFPLIMFVAIARIASRFFQRNRSQGIDAFEYPPMPRSQPSNLIRGRNSDESRVFRLALKLKGRLTVSDIVIETGLSLADAEQLVEGMVDNVHVRMEVDDQGRVVYEFPEIIRRLQGD